MAVKSIIDIDLNDAKFVAFKRLFDQYLAALKTMPASWSKAADSIEDAEKSFKALVGVTSAVTRSVMLLERSEQRLSQSTERSARSWRSMANDARSFASSVKDVTLSFAKWGGIGAITGLLGGAAGLFGIDRLAAGAAAARKSALGLGTEYGQQQAYGPALGRFGDPGAILNAVAAGKFDVTSRERLGLMTLLPGVSGQQLQNMDTTQAAIAVERKLFQLARTWRPEFFGANIGAFNIGAFTSAQDLERRRRTSPQEFEERMEKFSKWAKVLKIDDRTLKGWADFQDQLWYAGEAIKATFIKGLAPLTPSLSKLSDSAVNAVRTFLDVVKDRHWVDRLGKALDDFSDTIADPEFGKNVKEFVGGVGDLAKAVKSVLPNPDIFGKTPTGPVGDILKSMGAPQWTYDPSGAGVADKILGLVGMQRVHPFADRFGAFAPVSNEKISGGVKDRIKAGAGTIDPKLMPLVNAISADVPELQQFTSFADQYHRQNRPNSPHNEGRALDFTVQREMMAEAAAQKVRDELKRLGLKGKVVISGYMGHPLDPGATAPHIHVQLNKEKYDTGKHVDITLRTPVAWDPFLTFNANRGVG